LPVRVVTRVWNRVPKTLRGFILYNLLFFPVVAAIYTKNNIFWIQMSGFQLIKWFATAAFFGTLANIALAPWIRWVNAWLGRRGYYLKKEVGVAADSPS